MIIAGKYSFNDGELVIERKYPRLLSEVQEIVAMVNADRHKRKISREKTMPGKRLYSPVSLNRAFKKQFESRGWKEHRIECEYQTKHYIPGYRPRRPGRGAFRSMDFVKQKLGVEVQFGKYAFMVYNVCAKMTIFQKAGVVDAGIEIVPMNSLTYEMSSGVSYFEQFVWDLEARGTSNIDIPVLILGIDVKA